jgi:hypothetical protein
MNVLLECSSELMRDEGKEDDVKGSRGNIRRTRTRRERTWNRVNPFFGPLFAAALFKFNLK